MNFFLLFLSASIFCSTLTQNIFSQNFDLFSSSSSLTLTGCRWRRRRRRWRRWRRLWRYRWWHKRNLNDVFISFEAFYTHTHTHTLSCTHNHTHSLSYTHTYIHTHKQKRKISMAGHAFHINLDTRFNNRIVGQKWKEVCCESDQWKCSSKTLPRKKMISKVDLCFCFVFMVEGKRGSGAG